jgi:rhodanese-related sulfurtransferase
MTTLTPIDPKTLRDRLKAGDITLIDIREPDEFAREHIAAAQSVPLSTMEKGRFAVTPQAAVVFHCKSGMRTNSNCARLAAHVDGEAFMLEGGLDAWKQAGLPIATDAKAPLELNRQVQIVIGTLMLTGVALTLLVEPAFIALPAFLGAGLLFAGVSGWCGMAHLIALAPWNRRAAR